ncbi:hypothetical protein BCR36DRAFT_395499 [Piromyces finnis]|uniref:Uncharacterized protein n=1 Tax=Piromyces finnis TaxID=1754191 RepID=A0A1Y1VHU0_9FUNG|nr:hypothetical protein BCR36DRAFT_395499 [Piromyces finnis]|eukprot:ORX56534.1 hypothetical protein BCR36DRAFT_395499 [Piromyces finnis]
MFSFETLIQDRQSFNPGEIEGKLQKKINDLQKLQDKIYFGQLGLEPTIKMNYLDEIFISHKCFNIDLDLCEDIEENIDYDFTKEMVNFNVNELIDEYLDRARSILSRSDIRYEKTKVDPYSSKITLDNFREYRQRFLDDADCQFQYEIFDYIIGALQRYETIIYQILNNKIKNGIMFIVLFYLIGMLLIIFSILYTKNTIKNIKVCLTELINIVFIVPKSVVENSSEFKKFIETGNLIGV